VKSALAWLASLLAAALLVTPSYGIGIALSPLTLIGSWVAMSPPSPTSAGTRAGAALNLLLVVAGLALVTVIWWPTGWFLLGVAWALLWGIVALSYTLLLSAGGEAACRRWNLHRVIALQPTTQVFRVDARTGSRSRMGFRSLKTRLPERFRARVERPFELRMGSPQYGRLLLDGLELSGVSSIEANSLLWSSDGRRLAGAGARVLGRRAGPPPE
jgi:hypothetical protein